MTQLFQHKWVSTEGDHLNEGGQYAENFIRWAEELKGFDDDCWKRAYKRIEYDIRDAAKMGEDIWPPSSVAVLAYAEPPICSQMYKTFDRAKGIEDQTAKAHRKEVGAKECGNILSMFD